MATVHEILLNIVGESRDGEQALNRIARKVIETGSLKASPEVDLKGATEAFAKIAAMRAALDELDGKNVNAEFSLKTDRARTSLSLMEAELRSVMARVTQSRRTGSPLNESELRRVTQLLVSLGRESEGIGKLMAEAGGGAGNLNQQFSGMLGFVKQINPVMQGLVIVIIAALVPAMVALAASLVAAAGGFAVLANALLAALGPAVLFAIGIFQRFALILQALQARRSAMSSQVKKSAQEQLQEAQAAEQNRNAHNAVRDAIEQRVAAQARLAQAQQAARRQIADAQRAEVAASQALKIATQDAYDAMAQSIRDATTALHAFQSAQLGIEQSKLDTKRARLELAKLRADMGLTGQKFDQLFNQLTDVSINPAQLRKAIQAQLSAGNITQDQALQLQQAHLDVQRAVLGEKEATDRLAQSKADLNKADRTQADFLQNGINAYRPYVQAVNTAAKAERDYQRLLKLGVQQNPQVVQARNALRDASQRVKEAQHDLNAELKIQKLQAQQATGPLAQYHALLKKLTPVEREFVKFLIQLRKGFAAITREGTDAFFAGLIVAFGNLKPVLGAMKDGFTALGAQWARNTILFSKQLMEPRNLANLRLFGQAALQLSDILGGRAFRAFFQIMLNLARIAMPLLVQFSRDFAGWLERAANNTADISKTAPIINQMVESFRVWLGFIKGVGNAIGAMVEVIAPFGDEIVGWLTKAVNAFADWLRSAKGRNAVSKFFQDALPLIRETLTFIGKLAVVFLQAFQFVAPVVAGVLHTLNDFLSIIIFILGVFNAIVSNPIGRAIRFAIGQFIGFGVVGKIIGAVFGALRRVGSILEALGARTGRITAFIRDRFSAVFGVVGRIGGVFRRAVGGAMGWFGSLPGRIGGVLRRVIDTLVGHSNPIVRAAGRIAEGVVGVFRGIGRRISGFFSGIVNVLKNVINAAIGVVNFAIRNLNKISVRIPGWVPGVGGHHFGVHIPKIPTLAKGGVPTGPVAALIGDVNEAVLPLQGAVLRNVASAIANELLGSLATIASSQRGGAGSPAGEGSVTHRKTTIENVNLAVPEGGVPDPRSAVSLLANELGRRGI